MYSCVKSYGINGIDAYAVTVETTLSRSIPSFDVVGLPDAAVKESRSRVQSALVHAGYELPVAKITVNLAPASQKKSGPAFDLPIFLAVMLASQQLEALPEKSAFVGELGLSGQLRQCRIQFSFYRRPVILYLPAAVICSVIGNCQSDSSHSFPVLFFYYLYLKDPYLKWNISSCTYDRH